MRPDDYKTAKKRSRITVSDIWLSAIRITIDQDKSFSSGRTPIPQEVEKRVNDLLCNLTQGAKKLEADLQQVLPECSVSLDSETSDITVTFPGGRSAELKMLGIDTLSHAQVYGLDYNGAGAATFVRMPQPTLEKDTENKKFRWFLWRGDFGQKLGGNLQNYPNPLTHELLCVALNRYLPDA